MCLRKFHFLSLSLTHFCLLASLLFVEGGRKKEKDKRRGRKVVKQVETRMLLHAVTWLVELALINLDTLKLMALHRRWGRQQRHAPAMRTYVER